MNKLKILTRTKGFFSALLLLTLGLLITLPLTSTWVSEGQSWFSHHMTIYMVLLLAWILLAVALGIAYLASEGSKVFKPIPLPVNREEGK